MRITLSGLGAGPQGPVGRVSRRAGRAAAGVELRDHHDAGVPVGQRSGSLLDLRVRSPPTSSSGHQRCPRPAAGPSHRRSGPRPRYSVRYCRCCQQLWTVRPGRYDAAPAHRCRVERRSRAIHGSGRPAIRRRRRAGSPLRRRRVRPRPVDPRQCGLGVALVPARPPHQIGQRARAEPAQPTAHQLGPGHGAAIRGSPSGSQDSTTSHRYRLPAQPLVGRPRMIRLCAESRLSTRLVMACGPP